MMDREETLRLALDIWKMEDQPHGPEYILLLARTGLFNHLEIAKITDRAPASVIAVTREAGLDLPPYRFGMKFEPTSLDTLIKIASAWGDRHYVPAGLAELASTVNTYDVTSRLTGVPLHALVDSLQP